jgi:hypothetical protein
MNIQNILDTFFQICYAFYANKNRRRFQMSMPVSAELHTVIIEELRKLGGKAKLSDLYESVTKRFPQLTKADLERSTPSGSNWWTGYIRFGLDALKKKGLVSNLAVGVWGVSTPPPPQVKASGGSENGFHSFQIALKSGGKASLVIPVNFTVTDAEYLYKILLSFAQK